MRRTHIIGVPVSWGITDIYGFLAGDLVACGKCNNQKIISPASLREDRDLHVCACEEILRQKSLFDRHDKLIYSGAKKKHILVGVRGQKVVIFLTRARAARARGQDGNFSRC